jgi:hypothetical protein
MTSFGDEGLTVMEWAYQRLTTDATLAGVLQCANLAELTQRVWEAPAPDTAGYPFVTLQVGTPTELAQPIGPGPSTLVAVPLQVKAVDRAETYARIRPVARRLAELLQGNHNWSAGSGGLVLTSIRSEVVQYPESGSGIEYRHLGAVWTVQAQ